MRDESTGWVTLHPGELYLLWTELGLGELPDVLEIPHVGRTAAARAELIAIADEALAGRGLGTVARPAPDLEELLRALAAPELTVDMRAVGQDRSFRAVGAIGRFGVVTIGVAEGDVRLGPVERAELVGTILGALSPLPAGPGGPGNARFADYRRACRAAEHEGAGGFLDVLRGAGVRSSEAGTFLRAIEGRAAGGYLGATSTAHGRSPGTVNWVDTEQGRYVLRRHGDWVTVTPADLARLHSMAEEMVADLA
ncbi:ESX secretion-associated protein EspG [Prauserella oleivorans]|uniref:ESX secretion-associated protein EspG n=1 Tax=Prauserella oleivorans TaxID=1478153 RepID=A0ABW5WI74_9PSEU